jgi:hypothetical protein
LSIVGVVLAATTAYALVNAGRAKPTDDSGLYISAQPLPERPQDFLVLNNPDSYVSAAISTPGILVRVGDWNKTQIDDQIQSNHTNNIRVNDVFFAISVLSADPVPLIGPEVHTALIVSWAVWALFVFLVGFVSLRSKANKHYRI